MVLPAVNRLKHRQDFNVVYRKGIRCQSRYLTLRAFRRCKVSLASRSRVDTDGQTIRQPSRFGISISQKVSKRAVIRNRIKRRIRAILRQLLQRVHPGWDLVIVVHPEAVECDYSEFLQELEQLLLNAEVLHGHS